MQATWIGAVCMSDDGYDYEDYEYVTTCPVCGGSDYHPMTGTCPDHIDYVECPDCGDLMPMVEGIYDPGTPDVYYLRNGDPGYPGDPPSVECVSCYA